MSKFRFDVTRMMRFVCTALVHIHFMLPCHAAPRFTREIRRKPVAGHEGTLSIIVIICIVKIVMVICGVLRAH